MTPRDYDVVMKSVGIAELKARLSEHLHWCARAERLRCSIGARELARIVPCAPEPVEVRRAIRRLRDLERPPRPAEAH